MINEKRPIDMSVAMTFVKLSQANYRTVRSDDGIAFGNPFRTELV